MTEGEERLRQRVYSKLRKGWDRDKYNAEGYKDMTAYLALKRVERDQCAMGNAQCAISDERIGSRRDECSIRAYERENVESWRRASEREERGRKSPSQLSELTISLRLGHATDLTCHRQVIQSRGDASLPFRQGGQDRRKTAKVRAGRRACREDERYRWEELANGIIIQAAQDWRAAMAILQENPEDPEARETVRETESFFLSEYYATLTRVDGAWLLRRLREEFALKD